MRCFSSFGLCSCQSFWLTHTSWAQLGWRRKGLLKAIGLGLLGFVLLYINVIAWALLEGNTTQPTTFTPGPVRLLLVACFAFGLPAWVEENLYRGYLQPLLAGRMSLGLAIVVQAAVFSVAHLGYYTHLLDFGMVAVTGLILGWLRKRDASLVGPYVAHGLFWLTFAFMSVQLDALSGSWAGDGQAARFAVTDSGAR